MNPSNSLIRLTDLSENTAPRLPVALCIDVSGSMDGAPLGELNRGIATFFDSLRANPLASRSAEVSITLFSDEPELALDFTALKRVTDAPQIEAAEGCTNLAGGVNTALDALDRCRRDMRATGVDHYKPFLVIMSDGAPNVGNHEQAARRVRQLEDQRRIVVFPIGIGDQVDMKVLSLFSKRGALHLKGLNFAAFFEWLSRSVGAVSGSNVGDTVSLPKAGMDDWLEY